MDLNVKYIPYVIRKVPVQEQKLPLRNLIDSKKTYFFCKRAFDVLASSFVILFLLSWVLPVLALLIVMESKGPVFFRQTRTGRGGKLFSCLKLRTMIVNDQADLLPASKNDARITRVGKFLRNANLDELPQFFNVLAGSMSIVGPRPHMIVDCNKFSAVVPRYKLRNLMKPGITGLAQVKGFHGPATDTGNIFLRYGWDAFYVRNAGFLLDIRIIRQTVGLLFA
ncbi:MAG: sugar transferase [Bacteroidota bacterium]|nr:sugar transferase [Bacteroidota bacterium]MDP4215976.1 sugar transferase [Bacteroidota bacterium]MDP4252529.1 sugar transferase [Bacteroidota bacterium]MDP4257835.1 sugar transferase [Bacteroidota bacterium]